MTDGQSQHALLAAETLLELTTHAPSRQVLDALADVDVPRLKGLGMAVRKSLSASLAAALEYLARKVAHGGKGELGAKGAAKALVEGVKPMLVALLADADGSVRASAVEAFAVAADIEPGVALEVAKSSKGQSKEKVEAVLKEVLLQHAEDEGVEAVTGTFVATEALKKTIADPELNPIQLYKEVRLLVDALKDGHHLVPPPLPPPPLAQQSGILPPLPPPMVRASSASSASSTRDAANDKGGYAAVIAELQAGVTLKQTGLRAPLTAGASLREQERNQAMTDETVEGTLRIALEQRRLAVKDDEI